jgi:glycosyltransferase involved in cell wall biosynthesis
MIYFDARFSSAQLGGISQDARNILSIFLNARFKITEMGGMGQERIQLPHERNTFLRLLLKQPLELKIGVSDRIFISQVAPIFSSNKQQGLRVHDIFPLTNPEWFNSGTKSYFRRSLMEHVSRETLIFCNSKHTQRELVRNFKSARTVLAPCWVDVLDKEENCQGCDTQEQFSEEYCISVSTVEPRKQTLKLIGAFLAQKDIQRLVIVGKLGWKKDYNNEFLSLIRNSNRISWLSNVCNSCVRRLVRNSRVLISFSLDEGFNLPIMEARLLGVPVIASDILVHREIHQEHVNLVGNSQSALARRISNFEQLVDVNKAGILNTKSREMAQANFLQFYSQSN